MDPTAFIDYYELLQVSPNADDDTIQRVFRHLAKKYHPDQGGDSDDERFRCLVDAHRVLSDPASRAGYDAAYQEYWNRKWKLVSEAGSSASFGELRTIDTATGASTLVGAFPGGAEVDSFAVATSGGSGLPWLVLTPTDGTVEGVSSFPIDAHFIADGATHYGLHQGTIRGVEDMPYPLPDVPVCFTKAFLDVPEGAFADVFIHAVAGTQITLSPLGNPGAAQCAGFREGRATVTTAAAPEPRVVVRPT